MKIKPIMSINEFILKDRKKNFFFKQWHIVEDKGTKHPRRCVSQSKHAGVLPGIIFKDGVTIDVQAGEVWALCKPREDFPENGYTHVYVRGYKENYPLLHRYMNRCVDDSRTEVMVDFANGTVTTKEFIDFYQSSYRFVPVKIVDKIIAKHGGIILTMEKENEEE